MCNYFFKKSLRLLNSISFNHVFDRHYQTNSIEISILGRFNLLKHPRLGLSVSRKNIKQAHNRNLIKRLIRETFRLLQYQLLSMDFVVIAKKSILFLSNKKILDILHDLWFKYYK